MSNPGNQGKQVKNGQNEKVKPGRREGNQWQECGRRGRQVGAGG